MWALKGTKNYQTRCESEQRWNSWVPNLSMKRLPATKPEGSLVAAYKGHLHPRLGAWDISGIRHWCTNIGPIFTYDICSSRQSLFHQFIMNHGSSCSYSLPKVFARLGRITRKQGCHRNRLCAPHSWSDEHDKLQPSAYCGSVTAKLIGSEI